MYECDIIELEDYSLNHYIHHFDECDGEHLDFNEEFGCIEPMAECAEEILWL